MRKCRQWCQQQQPGGNFPPGQQEPPRSWWKRCLAAGLMRAHQAMLQVMVQIDKGHSLVSLLLAAGDENCLAAVVIICLCLLNCCIITALSCNFYRNLICLSHNTLDCCWSEFTGDYSGGWKHNSAHLLQALYLRHGKRIYRIWTVATRVHVVASTGTCRG